jgi:non-specific serine/threonine protein kinase
MSQQQGDTVRLTKRERQIAELIARGLSNKQIASTLKIATVTAKTHVRNIMEKMQCHSRQVCAVTLVHESYRAKDD